MQKVSLLNILIDNLKQHIEELRRIDEEAKDNRFLQKYNLKQLIFFYNKQFLPKLVGRATHSQRFTDLVYWYLPKLVLHLNRIQIQIEKIMCRQAEDSEDKPDEQDEQTIATIQKSLSSPIQFIYSKFQSIIQDFYSKNQFTSTSEREQLRKLTKSITKIKTQVNLSGNTSQEEQERKIISLLYEETPIVKSKVAVKFMFRFLFIAKLKIRVKIANKHINERRMRILELVEGQRKYINGLISYVQNIKKPICKLNILSDLENKKLFSTIQSILAFHQMFFQQLNARFEQYHKYQIFGDLIKKNIPFFKLYTDYIQYADEAQTLLLKLQQINDQVRQICAKFMIDKEKKASDQLKQPTFRIARYGIIISEILKNTSNTHPDYQLLKQAQKQVSNNLTKINETVDLIAKRTRLHQLDEQFKSKQRTIAIAGRNFLEEFHLLYIRDDKLEPVFLYIFNDFLMVVDQNRKILKQIFFDEKFYVRREQDNKTYKNMVKIHSDGFSTFSAGTQDKHYTKANSMFKLLKSLSKNKGEQIDKMVYVQVIGTQQINTSTFSKYTQYIVEIKYLGMRKFSRLRYSLLKNFVLKMQEFYKSDLGICVDEGLKDGWFSNYSSKTIEDRKRAIEQLLQKMLNHSKIRQSPAFILNQLGIQPSFLKVLQKKKSRQGYEDEPLSPLKLRKSQDQEIREAETILCATQVKLGRNSYHDAQYINKKVIQRQRYTIYIHTMVGEQPMAIRISDLYSVQDVCYQLSSILQLKTNRDFKLFHEAGKKQLRVLDNDKKIIKLFTSIKKESNSSSSLTSIFDAVKSYILAQAAPKLIFKKYYYLPKQFEHSECKKDIVRLRLVTYQTFSQIKDMKYNLSFEDYIFFLACLIYIQYDGAVPEETETTYVKRIIPEKIFKLKNQSQQYWLKECRGHMLWLNQEINKIIQHNKEKVKNKKIRQDSIIHFSHRHICSQLALNKIRANKNYGSNLFYIQLTKQTYDKFQKQGRKPAFNMWLSIKMDSFMLLTPTSKQVVLEVKLQDIDRIVVQTQGVIFKIEALSSTEYSMNTYQSFEISELVKYYKALSQVIVQLEENKLLASKTRVYKQQLQTYRVSYEKAERETVATESTKEQITQVLRGLN